MKNILLLQLNRLGDLVQTVPLIKRIRRDNPEAKITLVAIVEASGILSECDYFDQLISIPLNDIDALVSPDLQSSFPNHAPFSDHAEFHESFDLVVNLTNTFGSAVICEKIKSARKLGRINTYEGELRMLGPWSKYLFAMVSHRLDNLFNLVDIQMGIAGLTPTPEPSSLQVSQTRMKEAQELLHALGRRQGRKLIALQTGASDLHRAWSLDNFAVVAQNLMANGFADILLMGDGRERERTEHLAEMIGMPVINLAGKTSLQQMPAVLKACDLLISNDTGTIHIAAAVGTPTLGLYFSTAYFSETAPYGPNHAVLQVEISCSPCHASERCQVQLCREFLTPPAVLSAARWVLNGFDKPPPLHPSLSLYRSQFLSNGSMIYLPAHAKEVSAHYRSGLLGRLLWEDVLGLGRDESLEKTWQEMNGKPQWNKLREKLSTGLSALAEPFREGNNLAEKLRCEFEHDVPVRERIIALHESLTRVGSSLAAASKDAGLCGSFLKFEMMDMDFATYPALAEILEEKYKMLSDWVDRFQATLSRLSHD